MYVENADKNNMKEMIIHQETTNKLGIGVLNRT
jgi:hypothetical protein